MQPISAALRQLLVELPATFPVEQIDRLWIFPPRQISDKEHGLVVLSLTSSESRSPRRRELITIRYEASVVRGVLRRSDTTEKQGWAPADMLPRLIAGVLARLGEERDEPLAEEINGDPARWAALLESIAASAG